MTRIKKIQTQILLMAGIMVCSQLIWAQEYITTARPTLSIGSWVLPAHCFQWEQGAQYADVPGEAWLYDAFLRAAISSSTELRILIPTLRHEQLAVSLKWAMMLPDGQKPGVALALSMSTVDGSLVIDGYRIAVEKILSDRLVAVVNAGKTAGEFFGDFTLAFTAANRLTLLAEYWHHAEWQQIQTGITYHLNTETQIDVNGGYLINAANDYTIGFGLSRRFKYKVPDSEG